MSQWLFNSAKGHGLSPELYQPGTYVGGMRHGTGISLKYRHGRVYAEFQGLLRELHVLDYDDILSQARKPLHLCCTELLSV